MNTNILRLIAESQKESINEKKLAKARQLCKEVEELCKKAEVCNNVVEFMEENNCTGIHLAGFPPAVTLLCMDLNPEVEVMYAYSERDVVEVEIDGQVVKKAIFSHKGFFPYIRSKEDLKKFIK